ncbi:MAG: ketosteroid isomerase-like protein [Chlamydiales bacterium]|jgi:ketosteroid isomerase-like protein
MSSEFIRSMFRTIDLRDWDSLCTFFCEDAVYERPGHKPLCGIDAIQRFYSQTRIIASGEHQLTHAMANDRA